MTDIAPNGVRARVRRPPVRRQRVAGLLREHRLLVAFLLAAAVLRVVVWLAFRPALQFYGDSFTYLGNAAHLAPRSDRPIGYPVVLALLMLPGNSLALVTAVHHVIGLALGVLVYALVLRFGAPTWAAAVAALPILIDGYQLDIEQFIMSEPLFQLLVLGAICLLLLPKRLTPRLCAAAGLVLALAALTRTLALVVAGPFVLLLLVRRVGRRRLTAFLLAFSLPLAGYLLWFHAVWGRYAIVGYDGLFLYGRVAQFADCDVVRPPPAERVLCEPVAPEDRLGPDFYDWSALSPRWRLPHPTSVPTMQVLGDFARRVIAAQPREYAQVVAGDVVHYFASGRFAGPRDWYPQTWRFPTRGWRERHLWHVTVATVSHNGTRPIRHHQSDALTAFLRGYQRVVSTPGPVLALGLVVGLTGAAVGRGRPGLRSAAAFLAVTGLTILVAPSATADFDYRYALPTLPLLPTAGILGAWAIAGRLRRRQPAGVEVAEHTPRLVPALKASRVGD